MGGAATLSGQSLVRWECPRCGHTEISNDDLPPESLYRPWHIRGRAAVEAYLATLPLEAREWLLALFVDDELNLLAVDTVARGDVSSCRVPFASILCRGHALGAKGFLLVHNHPSGDPTPSPADIRLTRRLRQASEDLEMPMLDHLIVAGDEIMSVGLF